MQRASLLSGAMAGIQLTESERQLVDAACQPPQHHHSGFAVGQRVVVTRGQYRGDEGIVLRHVGAKTVYKFQVQGVWSDDEWSYNDERHNFYGIEPKVGAALAEVKEEGTLPPPKELAPLLDDEPTRKARTEVGEAERGGG